MKNFLIDYFVDKESFIDLQIDFLKQDFFYSMNQDDLPPYKRILLTEDFSISEQIPLPYSEDPNGISYDTHNIFFYKTFLPAKIKRLSDDFLYDFYNYIREELLENQKERRKFLNEQKKRVASVIDNIGQFNFIDFRLFTELKSQLCQIEFAVNSPTLFNDKFLKVDKLAFKGWKEQDLLLFFTFLKEQKVISPSVTDADLGLFLERNFCVEKDDEVTELDNLNKNLSYFASGNKKTYKAEVRLKRLFDKFNINSST